MASIIFEALLDVDVFYRRRRFHRRRRRFHRRRYRLTAQRVIIDRPIMINLLPIGLPFFQSSFFVHIQNLPKG